jgi:hypothetical protein
MAVTGSVSVSRNSGSASMAHALHSSSVTCRDAASGHGYCKIHRKACLLLERSRQQVQQECCDWIPQFVHFISYAAAGCMHAKPGCAARAPRSWGNASIARLLLLHWQLHSCAVLPLNALHCRAVEQ